jgi:hypothetical protein
MTALMSQTPSTLADVVSPPMEPEFLGLLLRLELACRPGANGDRYAPLVGWPALRRMIDAGNYPSKPPDMIQGKKESIMVLAGR